MPDLNFALIKTETKTNVIRRQCFELSDNWIRAGHGISTHARVEDFSSSNSEQRTRELREMAVNVTVRLSRCLFIFLENCATNLFIARYSRHC